MKNKKEEQENRRRKKIKCEESREKSTSAWPHACKHRKTETKTEEV
jgi:hypothetical protein